MADSDSNSGAPTGGRFDSSTLLSMLLGNNQQQNAQLQAGAAEVGKVQDQATARRSAAVAGQQSAIAGAADVAAKQAEITYQQTALTEQLQRAFNLDPTVAGNDIATSLANAEAAKRARVGARAEFDEANSVGLLDNPVQFLVNQIRLPQLAAKNNALADQEDVALDNVKTKVGMLAAAKSTLVANTADQMKQVQLDTAKVNQEAAQAKVTEEEAKSLSATAAGKLQLLSLTDKMGDNARQTISGIISLQDREDYRATQEALRKEAAGKKIADSEEEARVNKQLKLVSDSLGMAIPVTVKSLRSLTNKEEQKAWYGAATTGVFGEDLQKSLGFYLGNGNRVAIMNTGGASTYQSAQKLAETGSAFQSLAERANAQSVAAGGKKMTASESKAAGFKMYEDSVVDSMKSPTSKTDLSSRQWDATYNPYVAPFKSFVGAIDTMPQLSGLKSNSVTVAVKNLLSTDAVRGDNLTSEQQQAIFASIGKQVEQRQITPAKAAADISVFMSAATAWNRNMTNYTLFGLPNQDSYLYRLDGGDNQKVDLMNPATVENKLIKRAVAGQTIQDYYNMSNVFGAN